MYGLNRYVCDVLEEMRTSVKTLNFAMIPSLIEEVQTMVNRMEMALEDMKDLKGLKEEIHNKKEEYETLKDKIRKIEKKIEKKKKEKK